MLQLFVLIVVSFVVRATSGTSSNSTDEMVHAPPNATHHLLLQSLKKQHLKLAVSGSDETYLEHSDGTYRPSYLSEYFPKYCCPLEVTRIKAGSPLPPDAIIAGSIGGRRYAYYLVQYTIFLKPEGYNDPGFSYTASSNNENFYDIVTNPHKCSHSWYRTRYDSEYLSTQPWNNGRTFAPSRNGFFMARVNGYPSVFSGTTFYYLYNGYYPKYSYTSAAGHEILTVDCLKSMSTMTKGKLIDIQLGGEGLKSLPSNDVVYFERSYKNNSTESINQKLEFTAERANTVSVDLSETFASTSCVETSQSDEYSGESTWSNSFTDSYSWSVGSSASAWFLTIESKYGREHTSEYTSTMSRAFSNAFSWSRSSCQERSRSTAEARSFSTTQTYSFADEIVIPPKSIAKANALSSPVKGTIPYTMTYELIPRVKGEALSNVLSAGIDFFNLSDRAEVKSDGRILVHFDGEISIDAGYQIVVDVTAFPMLDESDRGNGTTPERNVSTPVLSAFLKPK